MNLQTLDLNLLKVFEALGEERSVTRAGARVGLTQSSVSNALSRLRHVFGDELFVRTPQGMQPTPRAQQLAAPVSAALNSLRDALADATDFDPASATGTIRIATSDMRVMSFGAKLSHEVSVRAPNVELQFSPVYMRTVYSDLDANRLDLAISVFSGKPKRLVSCPFAEARLICIGRVGHPAFVGGLTLERYIAYPHVMVTFNADATSVIDDELAKIGVSRRVGVTVGDFLTVPAVLAETDYLAAIPSVGGPILTAPGTCETTRLPFEMPAWPVEMIWSRRADADPLQAWARNLLLDLVAA